MGYQSKMKLTDMTVEDLFDNDQFKMRVSIDRLPGTINSHIAHLFLERNEIELKEHALSVLDERFGNDDYINSVLSQLKGIKEAVKSIDRRTLQAAVNEAVRSFFDEHQDEMTVRINGAMERVIKGLPSTKRFRNYFIDAVSESRQAKIDALKKELSILEGKEEES